ncbi:MAG: hypothetical protein RPU91_16930 [Candidatus Sedimenticola sp. (ex Thyasira tokunagai)]
MKLQFVYAPSNMWGDISEAGSISSIFSQIRLCESRIDSNINPATERKRHHKLCSLVESIASDGIDDRSLELALELPIRLGNEKVVSGFAYLQLMELFNLSQNPLLSEEHLETIRVKKISWLMKLIVFLQRSFLKPEPVEVQDEPRSINRKPRAYADLKPSFYGLGKYSATPEEVKLNRDLFEHLMHGEFKEYFGEIMERELAGYTDLVELIFSMYVEAHKNKSGVLILAKPTYITTGF